MKADQATLPSLFASPQEGVLGESSPEMPVENDISDEQRLDCTEKLLAEHQDTIFRYAFRLSGCAPTAEDITQEVFLRAFRSLHQLRDEAAARGWLLVIARNEFARWCRKSAAAGVELEPGLADSLGVSEDEPAVDRNEWIQRALDELPSEFRLVLLMFYFEDLSYAEIAEQLQIPMGTVMSRLSRGRSHLKSALQQSTLEKVRES